MVSKQPVDFDGIKALDEQIEVLLSCKPLPESQVKTLCEKVSEQAHIPDSKWSRRNQTWKIAPWTNFKRLGCPLESWNETFRSTVNFWILSRQKKSLLMNRTSSKSVRQSRFVETFTVSSTTWESYLRLVDSHPTPTTSSWVTMLTVVTTLSRLSPSSLPWRSASRIDLLSWEETTKADRSPKCK